MPPTTETAGESDVPVEKPSTLRRVVGAVISLGVVGLIFIGVLPRLANYDQVYENLGNASVGELVLLLVVALWSLAAYWGPMVMTLPGLRVWQAAQNNLTSTAISNTLPVGGAFALGTMFAMYRSWGFSYAGATIAMLVAGIFANFVKFGLPVVAALLNALGGEGDTQLLVLSAIGIAALVGAVVLFALLLRSETLAQRIGEYLGKAVSWVLARFHRDPVTDWGERAVHFRNDIVGLVSDRWAGITIWTVVSQLSLYALLVMSLRAVGVSNDEVDWLEILNAFVIVRLITAIPITPGGVGVAEASYVGILSAGLGQEVTDAIAAGVLLFRFLSWFLPIPLGVVTWFYWRWTQRTPEAAARAATGPQGSITLP